MKAKELDKDFDEGKRLLEHLDLSKARRPNQEQKRVNVASLCILEEEIGMAKCSMCNSRKGKRKL